MSAAPATPSTPAARRDRLVALVARERPGLAPPEVDTEPCAFLGGPWESAAWGRAGRRVRLVCTAAGTIVSRWARRGPAGAAIVRGDDHAAAAELLAAIDRLLED